MVNGSAVWQGLQRLAGGLGLHVTRASNCLEAKRRVVLDGERIDTVLDVGANAGQYARTLRAAGYAGRIVSFEPLAAPFAALDAARRGDPLWTVVQAALGRADESVTMHVSSNTVSSSLLPILGASVSAAPGSAYVAEEQVTVRRLDTLRPTLLAPEARVFLKLDVQGFEAAALDGATEALAQVRALECEVSLVPLYEGQLLAGEMLTALRGRGFDPIWCERGFIDPATGHLLQLDVLFVRGRG